MKKTDKDYSINATGNRVDNRNLIDEWNTKMTEKNLKHKFIWNANGLRSLDAAKTDYVFGNIEEKSTKFFIKAHLKNEFYRVVCL